MKTLLHFTIRLLATLAFPCSLEATAAPTTTVRIVTDLGNIEIELYPDKAPLTVENFLDYVDSGFYDGTLFHRVVAGTLVQGGGYEPGRREKPTREPIYNEADNGLKNLAGTVAMARGAFAFSARAQFFVNTTDNPEFDYRWNTNALWGNCVFGKVISGMDVVKKIESEETGFWPFEERPDREIIIRKIKRLNK